MKKRNMAIAMIGALLVTGNVSAQAAEIPAVLSNQNIYLGSQEIDITAYSINDNNYVMLREIGKAVNFSVFYDASTDSIRITNTMEYVEPLNYTQPVIAEKANAIASSQKIYVDGQPVEMTAYNINDNNYIKLREIGQALNFSVTYQTQTNSVLIDKSLPYGTEVNQIQKETFPNNNIAKKGEGVIEQTPITEKLIEGSELSREDFSQSANPAIFDDVYTRSAYNAIRQSILDQEKILSGNNKDGFNPYYHYANFIDIECGSQKIGKTIIAMNAVLGSINGYYNYTLGVEPYAKEYYKFPGYRICQPMINEFLTPANAATDGFIQEINKLSTDREKVTKINAYLCSKLTYGNISNYGPNEIFTSPTPLEGVCATYSHTFAYLCQRANIPCVIVADNDHSWNVVYTDGQWLYVDATNNDIGDDGLSLTAFLLTESYSKQDGNPKKTGFAKELLIPGSTK